MIDVIMPKYPAAATNASWQKKKSVLDKLAKASKVSGLGAALTTAEEKFKLINFNLLDVGTAPSQGGNPVRFNAPQEFDAAKHKAEQHILGVVRPARQAMRLAAEKADVIALNADKTFTKTTATAAGAVAKALRDHEKRLMNIKLADFEERKQEKMVTAREVLQIFEVSLNSALSNGDQFVERVRRTPTAAVFNKDIQSACRKITQVIGNVNKIKSQGAQLAKDQPQALYNELEPWAAQGVRLEPNASREEALQAINQYARIVHDIRNWWA